MNRLIVALLAALDALIQAAVGLAVIAAPLTVLWATSLAADTPWGSLWPTVTAVWQLGNLVPLDVSLPLELLTATGIPADGAQFALSLAPTALAAFAIVFGLRSGRRAVRAGAWVTAFGTALVVSAAVAALVAITSRNSVVAAPLWAAIVVPTALYSLSVLTGAVVTAWREGDDEGPIDRLHDRIDGIGDIASDVVGLIVRGTTIVIAGLVAVGGAAVALSLALRGGQVMALFQASHLDVVGAVVMGIAQLAYLPTLIVWAIAWIAGPGFSFGAEGLVSPAATDVGVVPGIPVLGALPEIGSPWLLLVALVPAALGGFAGWVVRSRLLVLSDRPAGREPVAPRVVAAVGIALLSGAVAAGLVAAASGAIGPGALAHVGPHAGQVALAIGLEVLVGASILLLGPRATDAAALDSLDHVSTGPRHDEYDAPGYDGSDGRADDGRDDHETEPIGRLRER